MLVLEVDVASGPEDWMAVWLGRGPITRWVLHDSWAMIGRNGQQEQVKIVIPHELVSRMHADIGHENNVWFVEDLGSKNGTTLNGQRCSGRMTLKRGDRIQLGGGGPVLLVVNDPTVSVPSEDGQLGNDVALTAEGLRLDPSMLTQMK